MDEARRVLERLTRIEMLDRATAAPGELLGELRALLHEAEEWCRAEGGDAAVGRAVERLRRSLARDMIGV
jgi:alkylhydroperoxidase family enzyme